MASKQEVKKRFDGSKIQLIVDGNEKQRADSVLDAMQIRSGGFWEALFILRQLAALVNFTWNEQGNLIVDGKTEEKTNIVLLLRYIINNSISFFRLPGNSIFRNVLLNNPAVKKKLSEKSIKFLNSKGKKMVKPVKPIQQLEIDGTPYQRVKSVLKHMKLNRVHLEQEASHVLLLLVCNNSDNFSWNNEGNIIYNGEIVPNSNIVLLMKYYIKWNISFYRLPGHELFTSALLNNPDIKCKVSLISQAY